ncbi:MAG: hypothetical protein PHI34_12835 [Acidobacteriota bacterium]|nr:hypothetical protein [Acidobacteriota bacterium]
MNRKPKTTRIAALLAGLIVIAACAGSNRFYEWSPGSQMVKIRVTTNTAVLRLSPNPNGEIAVEKVAPGTTYQAIRKSSGWYEVQHRSEIGVVLTAYIHEADVEILEEIKTPAKRA